MADKDTSAQIVAAARKRFQHFGYGKTTMAEVAGDCSMSPGNLYRFFPGKLDIAEAIAAGDFENHLHHLARVAGRPGRGLKDKLQDFLFEELRRTYARAEKDPRGLELSRVIAVERPGFTAWMQQREHKSLVALMDAAGPQDDLVIADTDFAAEMILSATMKFRTPQLWSGLALAQLERELEGVLSLLVEGLSRSAPPARTRSQQIA